MKNKKFTYLLILSTIAVWGLILMRIYESSQDTGTPIATNEPKFSGPLHIEQHLDDPYTLSLKRDPFSTSSYALPIETDQATISSMKIPAPVPALPAKPAWPNLTYTGYINNPNTKKKIAIIQFGETQQYLDEGDSHQGVKLLKNATDSIQLSYHKETRYFKLK